MQPFPNNQQQIPFRYFDSDMAKKRPLVVSFRRIHKMTTNNDINNGNSNGNGNISDAITTADIVSICDIHRIKENKNESLMAMRKLSSKQALRQSRVSANNNFIASPPLSGSIFQKSPSSKEMRSAIQLESLYFDSRSYTGKKKSSSCAAVSFNDNHNFHQRPNSNDLLDSKPTHFKDEIFKFDSSSNEISHRRKNIRHSIQSTAQNREIDFYDKLNESLSQDADRTREKDLIDVGKRISANGTNGNNKNEANETSSPTRSDLLVCSKLPTDEMINEANMLRKPNGLISLCDAPEEKDALMPELIVGGIDKLAGRGVSILHGSEIREVKLNGISTRKSNSISILSAVDVEEDDNVSVGKKSL